MKNSYFTYRQSSGSVLNETLAAHEKVALRRHTQGGRIRPSSMTDIGTRRVSDIDEKIGCADGRKQKARGAQELRGPWQGESTPPWSPLSIGRKLRGVWNQGGKYGTLQERHRLRRGLNLTEM